MTCKRRSCVADLYELAVTLITVPDIDMFTSVVPFTLLRVFNKLKAHHLDNFLKSCIIVLIRHVFQALIGECKSVNY